MKFRGLALGLLLIACGDDGGSDGPATITKEAVLDYYGLAVGNCYRYQFSLGQDAFTQTAEVRVTDASAAFPGRDVREWTLTRQGGANTLSRFYEVVGGEVRILRETSRTSAGGAPITRFFDDPQIEGEGTPPVTLRLIRRSDGEPRVESPGRFTTTTTPQRLIGEDGMALTGDMVDAEVYVYDVFSEIEMDVDVDGTAYTGTRLNVQIERGGQTFALSEFIAPGIGFVRFEDFTEDEDFQLINFSVTRSDGTTEGDLTCP